MLNRFIKNSKSEIGFTLIELLIVLVILGVVSSAVVLKVNGSSKWADLKSCKANWNLIYNANLQYQNDLLLKDDTNLDYSQRSNAYYDLKTLATKGYLNNGDSTSELLTNTGISRSHNCDMQLINGIIYLLTSVGQRIPIKDIESLSSPENLDSILVGLPTISEPVGGFSITSSGAGTILGTKLNLISDVFFKEDNEVWPGRLASISKTSSTTELAFNAQSGRYNAATLIIRFNDGTYWYSKYRYSFG